MRKTTATIDIEALGASGPEPAAGRETAASCGGFLLDGAKTEGRDCVMRHGQRVTRDARRRAPPARHARETVSAAAPMQRIASRATHEPASLCRRASLELATAARIRDDEKSARRAPRETARNTPVIRRVRAMTSSSVKSRRIRSRRTGMNGCAPRRSGILWRGVHRLERFLALRGSP